MSSARFSSPAGAQLFISYRRDDTAGYARALNDLLAREFGAQRVFIDVDDIPAGQRFDQAIAQAVDGAGVLLVLIGPRWLAAQADGLPRLHSPDDFVHRELAAGLAAGALVLPLLLDGAAMPTAAQLPPALQALATRQAQVVDARRFGTDTAQLLALLRPVMGAAPTGAGRRRWLAGMGVAALALAAAGGWWATRPTPRVVPAGAGASAVPRPAINGRWEAEVDYDWPGAHFREQLVLQGEGRALAGTASFLRVARGIEQGEVDGDGLRFVTRSNEQLGEAQRSVTHRYSGKLDGDTLRLTMQTEGAAQPHAPVVVVARRVAAP